MAGQLSITPELSEYVRRVSVREDEILQSLRAETALLPMGTAMQVPAEEGQFLAFLVALTGASTVVEVGTFTGYSTLCMARAVGPGGRIVTCDISPKWPGVGEPFWKRAGVDDRIDLRIGDASATLAVLLTELGPGSVDLVFIDADKTGYARYYEAALELLTPRGLIVVDNTLYFGRVVAPDATDADTRAIREFNEMVHADARVDLTLLSAADGITLIRRR